VAYCGIEMSLAFIQNSLLTILKIVNIRTPFTHPSNQNLSKIEITPIKKQSAITSYEDRSISNEKHDIMLFIHRCIMHALILLQNT